MHASSAHAYDRVSQYYDLLQERRVAANMPQCVELLAALVGRGRALELGVGTGRIALPLAASGAVVSGIDNSPLMLDRLRDKPGAERLTLVCDDFLDVPIAGPFDLIYSVFLFGYLLAQSAQVRCMVAVHERLSGPRGVRPADPAAAGGDAAGRRQGDAGAGTRRPWTRAMRRCCCCAPVRIRWGSWCSNASC